MRRVIGATLAGALLAAFAVLGCDRGSTALAQSTGGDSGIGQPNPMPGSPIADSGATPINPGTPSNPGNPGSPGAPTGTPSPTSNPGTR
jgi:hypothetical protein